MVVTENDFWRMGHEGKGKLIFKKEKKKKKKVYGGARSLLEESWGDIILLVQT